jgi:import receptor subunit TOM70
LIISGPLPTLPENPSTGDNTLLLALQALEAADYTHTFTLVNESLDQGISWNEGKAEALNLRGTFKYAFFFFSWEFILVDLRVCVPFFLLSRFLVGDVESAKADLQQSIVLVPSYTQSLVKIASVHMEQGDPKKAFECFEEAIKHHPTDPDIYYHRGQGEISSIPDQSRMR